jgi:MerR family copper efflux transcriptional regulator
MRIGELASQAQVNIQTLRYYERRGLLPASGRQPSGYRRYDRAAVTRVRFIRRAQALGFTLREVSDLLRLWPDSRSSCGMVERRARAALTRIDQKLGDLARIRRALAPYISACGRRPSLAQCPLLAALGESDHDDE